MFGVVEYPELSLSVSGYDTGITYRVDRLLEAAMAALLSARIIRWPSQVIRSDVTRYPTAPKLYMDVALRSMAPASRASR